MANGKHTSRSYDVIRSAVMCLSMAVTLCTVLYFNTLHAMPCDSCIGL